MVRYLAANTTVNTERAKGANSNNHKMPLFMISSNQLPLLLCRKVKIMLLKLL